MKFYVCASLNATNEARRLAIRIAQAGHEVVSTWLTKDFSNLHDKDEDAFAWGRERQENYVADMRDLDRANCLVMLAGTPSSCGGMWFELGWWLGSDRVNAHVINGMGNDTGEGHNIFTRHEGVTHHRSQDEFISSLGRQEWKKTSTTSSDSPSAPTSGPYC